MSFFRILRRNNELIIFSPKEKEDQLSVTYRIINFIYPLGNSQMTYYDKFNLRTFRVLNNENLPSYWGGAISSYDSDLLKKLYQYGKIHQGWDYYNDDEIGFTCNKSDDTIVGDKFNLINIEGTYKSPSWVNQEMCRCIDEFMLSYLEYGIQNL